MTQDTYALAVHGGAGNAPLWSNSHEREALKESLALALETGQSMLRRGATSVDTVEAVTRSLEDDPYFNAGHGSFPNYNGEFELDASIMEGGSGNCGAVAGVRTIRNPVSAARAVMDHSPHVLLCGTGADEFAKKFGMDLVESDYFRTEHRMAAWQRARRRAAESSPANDHLGTVGCVALDQNGNLAAATSTGGITLKRFGRVGDSPLIGAGTYANNETCAVSCTGNGEQFIKHCVAFSVSALMHYRGWKIGDAVDHVVDHILPDRCGGLIAVGRDGSLSVRFNTRGMNRGLADFTGRFEVGI